jgi:GH15 family glucan-1,4-alpha-glucosidase
VRTIECVQGTVNAELICEPLKVDETDGGLSGKEGTFAICTFWLVSALSEIGDSKRAAQLLDKMLDVASPLQLFAEEIDATSGRHLGNYPQAFTHLALISAVST